MEIQKETVSQDPITGTQEVTRTAQSVPSQAAVENVKADKTNAYVWYVVSFIEILLVLRLVFLLLGARNTGFTSLIYSITHPFTIMFEGIFKSPAAGTAYFDTPTVLAMLIIALVGWGIASLISISKHPKVQA